MSTPLPPGMFRAPEFCKATGATYRMADHWDRLRVLEPSIADAKGSGSQRLYSYQDVALGRVLVLLRRLGAPLRTLRVVTAELRLAPSHTWPLWAIVDEAGAIHPPDTRINGWIIAVRTVAEADVAA
jgi:DNA-binding transcriptional MerR regulator